MCQLWQTLSVAFQLFLLLSLYTWLLIPPGSHLPKKGIRGSWTHLFSCSVLINLSPLRWSYSMSTECSSCQGEMQVSFLGALRGKDIVALYLEASVCCLVLLQLSSGPQGEPAWRQSDTVGMGEQRDGKKSRPLITELTNLGITVPSCSTLFKIIHFPYCLNHFQFYFSYLLLKVSLLINQFMEHIILEIN